MWHSGLQDKRYWTSWRVFSSLSWCCWLSHLSEPVFLEMYSWVQFPFCAIMLVRANVLSHFWWGEMGSLVHYYHVVLIFGAVSVQEHNCLWDCSFNCLVWLSIISMWINASQRMTNSGEKCCLMPCPGKALLSGWTGRHKKFGNSEVGWKVSVFSCLQSSTSAYRV